MVYLPAGSRPSQY